jgi:hypothetical protein
MHDPKMVSQERQQRTLPTAVLWAMAYIALGYSDRVNMSVAVVHIAEEKGWSMEHRGAVMSAFFYGVSEFSPTVLHTSIIIIYTHPYHLLTLPQCSDHHFRMVNICIQVMSLHNSQQRGLAGYMGE